MDELEDIDVSMLEELPIEDIEELPVDDISNEEMSGINEAEENSSVELNEIAATATDVEQTVNNLDDVDKSFVMEHLTPEIVELLGILGGQTWFEFFNQFSDESRLLVPVNRAKFLRERMGQQSSGELVPEELPSEDVILTDSLTSIGLPS